jgi:putative restriction endonuclease
MSDFQTRRNVDGLDSLSGDAVPAFLSRDCSTPFTSSWMRTSSFGQPIISNGLPLMKLHHAAFDTHLIGVHPDFRIHVSDRLLEIHDGPFLELSLKGIAGALIERPKRVADWPDRGRLALRFEQFKRAA